MSSAAVERDHGTVTEGPDGQDARDWLQIGPAPGSGRSHRLRRWLLAGALPLALVATTLGPRWTKAGEDLTGPATSSPPAARSTPPPILDQFGPPQVRQARQPLLPVRGGWELYGRGDNEVVRIEPRKGWVTRTPVPPMASARPVSFLATGSGVVIRPQDPGPGYWVPDGCPARPLPTRLGRGGEVLPGPRPDEVWIPSTSRYSNRTVMLLASLRTGTVREVATLPADATGQVAADGTGSYYFGATGGAYGPGRRGYRRITTGTVPAAGARTFLTAECDEQHRCRHVLIEQRDGNRRTVRLLPSLDVSLALAEVSPDGRYAALLYRLATTPLTLHLLDLDRGTDRPIQAAFGPSLEEGALAWSPDGTYLFALGGGGRLTVVHCATARNVGLPISLPPLRQLAVAPRPDRQRDTGGNGRDLRGVKGRDWGR